MSAPGSGGRVEGLEEWLATLQSFGEAITAGAQKGVDEVTALMLARSQELVPRQSGHLAASGYTTPGQRRGGEVTGEVGYSADYALEIEEDTSRHHPNGQAKFFRTAFDEVAPRAPGIIGDAVREALDAVRR